MQIDESEIIKTLIDVRDGLLDVDSAKSAIMGELQTYLQAADNPPEDKNLTMPNIERVEPIITPEQLIRILELAVSSKTNELEIAAAKVLHQIGSPAFIYKGEDDGEVNKN